MLQKVFGDQYPRKVVGLSAADRVSVRVGSVTTPGRRAVFVCFRRATEYGGSIGGRVLYPVLLTRVFLHLVWVRPRA